MAQVLRVFRDVLEDFEALKARGDAHGPDDAEAKGAESLLQLGDAARQPQHILGDGGKHARNAVGRGKMNRYVIRSAAAHWLNSFRMIAKVAAPGLRH